MLKSVLPGQQANSFDYFFLAMGHWQLGDRDKAAKYYAQAVDWMDKNKPEDADLHRFRAEAANVLGIRTGPQAAPPRPPEK
jgi:hypothetical protein